MNIKSIPAVLALIAGFVTCIMSFIQHVDVVIFARNFVIVCIVFFIIGTIARIVIEINFKDLLEEQPEETEETEEEDAESEGELDEDDITESREENDNDEEEESFEE